MVPVSFGCGLSVLAAMAMLAPSRAARSAIASPMPRDAPVMKSVWSLRDMISTRIRSGSPWSRRVSYFLSGKEGCHALRSAEPLSQGRVRTVDAVGALAHGALETAGLHRQVLRKKTRNGNACRGVVAVPGEPLRRERFLRQQRPAGRE